MQEWISQNSTTFRISIFLGLFVFLALWEILYPNHKPALEKKYRWASNILLVLLNNAAVRILFPVTAIAFAEYAVQNRWGFLSAVNLPAPASFVLGILFLDFVIYLQHAVFHSLPLLWRLHRMHHADLELDVTSGTRFHPIEIIISMFIKIAAIAVSGVSPFTVLIFEVILNGMAMFNHSNIYIPEKLDRILRFLFVTPAMHRIHHSVIPSEYNMNYGFNLSVWDRIFGTMKNSAQGTLVLGLNIFREKKDSRLDQLLIQPFRN